MFTQQIENIFHVLGRHIFNLLILNEKGVFSMRVKICSIMLFLLLASGTLCFGTAEKAEAAPFAFAPDPQYTFKNALDGDSVIHDFIIQNKGTAELKIERVQTG